MAHADVSVVVPVYNNAATLPELHRRMRAALGLRLAEIIMVDDGSTDDSAAVAERLGATLIRRPRNAGQNAAILTGLAAANRPVCCVLDADLEDPPEALAELIDRLDRGDIRVVFSSRDERRLLTSRLFRRAMRLLYPTLPSHPCLCFAIDADTRERVLESAGESDYLPAVIGALGVPTSQVDVRRGLRPDGRSGYTRGRRVRYAARALRSAIRLRWRGAAIRR